MNQQEELFQSVTIDDILRVMDTYLLDSNMTQIEYLPQEVGEEKVAAS